MRIGPAVLQRVPGQRQRGKDQQTGCAGRCFNAVTNAVEIGLQVAKTHRNLGQYDAGLGRHGEHSRKVAGWEASLAKSALCVLMKTGSTRSEEHTSELQSRP